MKSSVFFTFLLVGAIDTSAVRAAAIQWQASEELKGTIQPSKVQDPSDDASLAHRCQRLLEAQIEVYHETRRLHKVIQGTLDQRPRPQDEQSCRVLARKQSAIALEVTRTITFLEGEEATAAFPEVFQGLHNDMERLQRRLEVSDVGLASQALEEEISATLREMIAALKTH